MFAKALCSKMASKCTIERRETQRSHVHLQGCDSSEMIYVLGCIKLCVHG